MNIPHQTTQPPSFTGREDQVIALLKTGLSNREIAEKMFVDIKTIDAHMGHIKAKLNILTSRKLLVHLLHE